MARPLDKGHLEVYQGREVEVFELPPPKVTHWGLVENFVRAVKEGEPLICPGEEGLKTNLVMEAAYRSARRGEEKNFFILVNFQLCPHRIAIHPEV